MKFSAAKINTGIMISMLASSVLCSCGPSRRPVTEIGKFDGIYPTNLSVDEGHEKAVFRWRTNRNGKPIQGYNIYISEHPVIATDTPSLVISETVHPFNSRPYPGDTDPATEYETFEATGLRDGMRYYAVVATLFPGGSESRPSNMIEFICHPSGTFSLRQSYSGERDGYSFIQSRYVASDDLENQIYYALIGGDDYLLSPSRLDDVLQSVTFYPLKIESISDGFSPPQGSGEEKIRISDGDGCLLETRSGQYAKIIVRGFSGSGKDREVNLEFSFMPVPGYADF